MELPGLARRGGAIGQLPALGALTMAAMLPDGWTCNYLTPTSTDDELVEQVLQQQPDLVAISALTASILEAYAFADRIRAAGAVVAMGGLHVSSRPDEASQHSDIVVIGNGEVHWPTVLADVARGNFQRRYEASRGEPFRWVPPRLDLLPDPPQRFTLQTQRGCPLACEFCGASRLVSVFREKPVELIAEELGAIGQLDERPVIELADDNTFAGTRDVQPLLDVMRQSGARWFTEADWRIGENPQLLSQLADAGCVQILVGIESLVFRYPGMRHKQAELDRIMNAVAAIQDAGVVVNGCFIVGAEGETQRSLDRLIDFLAESDLAEAQVTLQTPFPGTALYDRMATERRLLKDRDWNAYTLFDVTYQPDQMSVGELEEGFQRVLASAFGHDQNERRQQLRREAWRRRKQGD